MKQQPEEIRPTIPYHDNRGDKVLNESLVNK